MIYAPEARQLIRTYLQTKLRESYQKHGDSSGLYQELTDLQKVLIVSIMLMDDNMALDGCDESNFYDAGFLSRPSS